MKSGGPWSVKGIEPQVRETAKTAARKAGKTLGEWLNQVIMDSGQPDASEAAELLKDPGLWENFDGRAPWSEALEDLAAKLDASEKSHQALLKNIDRAIAQLAARVQDGDKTGGNGGGSGPDVTQEISSRLTALEEHSKRTLSKDNLKDVEGAMVQVAQVLDRNNKSHEDRFASMDASFKSHEDRFVSMDASFNELRARLEETERQVTEALGRIEEGFDTSANEELHNQIVSTVAQDIAGLDERILAAQERSDQTLEQVQHNISDIVSRLNDSGERIDAAIAAPLEKAKSAVAEVSKKVDAQTEAHEARVAKLEATIAELKSEIDAPAAAPDTSLADARTAELENQIGELNQKLTRSQEENLEALADIRASLTSLTSRLDGLGANAPAPTPSVQVEFFSPPQQQDPEPAKDALQTAVHEATPEAAPQPEPKAFGLRKKPVADAVRDAEAKDPYGDDLPTEFDQLVQPETSESGADAENGEAPQKESKLGWAARAFRKSEPLKDEGADEIEPFAPDAPLAEETEVVTETEVGEAAVEPSQDTEAAHEAPEIADDFFETISETLADADHGARQDEASLEEALRREGPTSAKSRQRKSVDDYFKEGPINRPQPNAEDEEVVPPRPVEEVAEEEDAPSLDILRSSLFSQDDDEADNMRGALSEIIEPDHRGGKRRTALWVIGGIVMLLMIVGSVLVLTGGAKDILNVSGRPQLLQDIGQTFKNLVSPETTPEANSTATPDGNEPQVEGSPPDKQANAGTSNDGATAENTIPASHIGSPNYFQVAEVSPAESLQQAAEDGSAKAQYALALAYANGTVVSKDETKAVKWYRAAAEKGLAPAQYRLAVRLEQGRGVTQNAKEAVSWYMKAANGGNRNAMHNLAVLYVQGKELPQDLTQAARWFKKAANLGMADAQFNLGILYARGLGVEQNDVEAYKWFSLSQKSGDLNAQEQLDLLAPKLTTGDLNYIDLFVESWAPVPLDPIANGRFDVAPEAYSDRSRRAIIARAQGLLANLGFSVAAEDGIIDSSTQEAVRSFQALSDLPVTGAISSDLLSRLESQAQ